MKKAFLLLGFVILCSCGCGGIHTPFSYTKHEDVKEPGGFNFVLLESGEMIKTKIITAKSRYFTLDNKTLDSKDVKAYQTNYSYAAKVTGHDFFVNRIVRGKINVYSNKSVGQNDLGSGGGVNAVNVSYYVQKGSTGDVVEMTPKTLREMLKDNEEAFKIVHKMKNIVVNVPKMEKAIKIYNEN